MFSLSANAPPQSGHSTMPDNIEPAAAWLYKAVKEYSHQKTRRTGIICVTVIACVFMLCYTAAKVAV